MNISEACDLLGVTPDSSADDVKKSFRKLAAKYHPDNKSTGDEAKFKKLNEANRVLESYRNGTYNQVSQAQPGSGFSGFPFNIEDIFGGFGAQNQRHQPPPPRRVDNIVINVPLTFKESVLGCKKDVTYTRTLKCDDCSGMGRRQKKTDCKHCGGMGVLIARQGFAVVQRTCPACGGRQSFEPCSSCGTTGSRSSQVTNTVRIPPGVKSGVTLRIEGAGNYAGHHVAGDMYSSILLQIVVDESPTMKLIDKDVVSNVTISLLEALTGVRKDVETIRGVESIDIPPLTKNNDQTIIEGDGLAVPGGGVHRVVVGVEYPKNVDDLVKFLSKV